MSSFNLIESATAKVFSVNMIVYFFIVITKIGKLYSINAEII